MDIVCLLLYMLFMKTSIATENEQSKKVYIIKYRPVSLMNIEDNNVLNLEFMTVLYQILRYKGDKDLLIYLKSDPSLGKAILFDLMFVKIYKYFDIDTTIKLTEQLILIKKALSFIYLHKGDNIFCEFNEHTKNHLRNKIKEYNKTLPNLFSETEENQYEFICMFEEEIYINFVDIIKNEVDDNIKHLIIRLFHHYRRSTYKIYDPQAKSEKMVEINEECVSEIICIIKPDKLNIISALENILNNNDAKDIVIYYDIRFSDIISEYINNAFYQFLKQKRKKGKEHKAKFDLSKSKMMDNLIKMIETGKKGNSQNMVILNHPPTHTSLTVGFANDDYYFLIDKLSIINQLYFKNNNYMNLIKEIEGVIECLFDLFQDIVSNLDVGIITR